MRIDPAVAAMRRDPALQRRAQAAMIAAGEEWRREPPVAAMLAELERFGAGEPLEACPALDTATGFRALGRVARGAGDPLAAPAGALRAQLVEAHPELLSLEDGRCPA